MKNTRRCPKCGCTKLLRVEDAMGDRGVSLVLGWLSTVSVTRYVCCDCGYVESWVDKGELHEVRARYEKENAKK